MHYYSLVYYVVRIRGGRRPTGNGGVGGGAPPQKMGSRRQGRTLWHCGNSAFQRAGGGYYVGFS